eukprot:jgi/Tetstr1/455992/TSEL_042770.t1
MGAWAFHNWSGKVDPHINIMPIELPGRNSRLGEPKAIDMKSLVMALADGVAPILEEGKPYAVFGHSMGAWIGYELVQELQRRGVQLPLRLYVSANRAPQLAGVEHDVHPVELHKLGFSEFWEAFEQRYGRIAELKDASVRKYIWPLFQADFQVIEQYKPPLDLSLPVDIVAFGVEDDTRYTREQMQPWAACSADKFSLHWIPGAHSYIMSAPEPMLRILEADLLPLVRSG